MNETVTLAQKAPCPETAQPGPAPIGPPVERQTLIFVSVFVASAAVMLLFNWHLRFDLSDDAYIHLRIAYNLIRTGHPYFNPGERVMVTSSPAWTVVLACNDLLFGTRNTSWIWNAICIAGAATASYALAWFHVRSLGAAHKAAALLLPVTVLAVLSNSSPGMETPLAIGLLLLSAGAFLRSSRWALPLLTLAALTRYELAVPLVVVGIVCLMTHNARKYGAVPALSIGSAFAVWLWIEFGTFLPSAIAAKSRVYVLTPTDAFESLVPHFLVLAGFENALLLLLLVVVGMWVVDSLLHPAHREPTRIAALALLLWGLSLGLLYIAGKAFVFEWYKPLVWCPLLVGILLMVLIDASKARRILALCFVFTFFLNVYAYPIRTARAAFAPRPEGAPVFNESRRVHVYLTAGAFLRQACPQAQLMTSEIGGLGYSFQGLILDGVGIASPSALKYHPMAVPQERSHPGLGAIPARFALERKPDLIFTYDVFGEAVLASREIQASYEDVRFDPVLRSESTADLAPVWGARTLHVLVKRGGACSISTVEQGLSEILRPQDGPPVVP